MAELATIARGTVILQIELLANFFGGFGLDDLSLDGMGEETIEAILAISHVEMDTGVVAAVHMGFAALAGTLVDGEILFGTEVFYRLQLGF